MTPEQRLDRVERILTLFVRVGRRTRSEWHERSREQDERISIIIKTQMETEEIMKGLALGQGRINQEMYELAKGQARVNQEMVELAKSQKLTDQALRAFINRSGKRENGESSNQTLNRK